MSGQRISTALRRAVAERADYRCEYCRMPEIGVFYPHEPDHIIAEQHGGETTLENLALSCFHRNRHKGPNVASIDPQSGQIVPLFNPRRDVWTEHFRIETAQIVPLTITGRITASLFKFNAPERLQPRLALWQAGYFNQM